jgi:hypothetical protein
MMFATVIALLLLPSTPIAPPTVPSFSGSWQPTVAGQSRIAISQSAVEITITLPDRELKYDLTGREIQQRPLPRDPFVVFTVTSWDGEKLVTLIHHEGQIDGYARWYNSRETRYLNAAGDMVVELVRDLDPAMSSSAVSHPVTTTFRRTDR